MIIFPTVLSNYEHSTDQVGRKETMISVWKNLKIRHCIVHHVTGFHQSLDVIFYAFSSTRKKNLYKLKIVFLHVVVQKISKVINSIALLCLGSLRRKSASHSYLMWKSWKNNSVKITYLKNGLIILDLKFVKSLDIPCLQNPVTNGEPVKIKYFPITSLNSSEKAR